MPVCHRYHQNDDLENVCLLCFLSSLWTLYRCEFAKWCSVYPAQRCWGGMLWDWTFQFVGWSMVWKMLLLSNHPVFLGYLPPRKLTWQWKILHLKMYFLLNMGIFQHHVSFQGSMLNFRKLNPPLVSPLKKPTGKSPESERSFRRFQVATSG